MHGDQTDTPNPMKTAASVVGYLSRLADDQERALVVALLRAPNAEGILTAARFVQGRLRKLPPADQERVLRALGAMLSPEG